MVYMEYIFNIFNRRVVSAAWEVTQTNRNVMLWCVRNLVIHILFLAQLTLFLQYVSVRIYVSYLMAEVVF